MMGFGMFGGMFLFWIILIGLAVLAARGLFQPNQSDHGSSKIGTLTARQILDQRYARGEINQEQYQLMLKDIQQ